jgi:general secretion pathway protein M
MVFFKRFSSFSKVFGRIDFDSLNPREKWIVAGGGLFVLLFVIIQFAIFPFLEARQKRISAIETKKSELVEIKQLSTDYLALKGEENSIQSRIEGRPASFTLFTFLDQQAGIAGLKKQIVYMKPSVLEGQDRFDEVLVEMKFEGILLKDLVTFLSLVESTENAVFVNRLSIQSGSGDGGTLDSIMQIMTLRKKEAG